LGGVDGRPGPHPDRETAKDLGEDDAGVSPSPHQRAVGRPPGDPGEVGLVQVTNVPDRRLQGEQHVGPGITVRDGKDVEGVDLVPVDGEPGERTEQGLPEEVAVADRYRYGLCGGFGRRDWVRLRR